MHSQSGNNNDEEVTYHIVMKGKCWLLVEGKSIPLASGDLVIMLKRFEHVICDVMPSKKCPESLCSSKY